MRALLSVLIFVLSLCVAHAETGIAAFYGVRRTASGEVFWSEWANCGSSHLAFWDEGPCYKYAQRPDRRQ
jgi:hypothetical protein